MGVGRGLHLGGRGAVHHICPQVGGQSLRGGFTGRGNSPCKGLEARSAREIQRLRLGAAARDGTALGFMVWAGGTLPVLELGMWPLH